jgi:ATP-binding cassette, subfamily B, bacterial
MQLPPTIKGIFQGALGPFWRNARRCLLIGWRQGRTLFVSRLFVNIVEGLVPLASAYLAGRIINGIVTILRNPGSSARPIMILIAVAGGLQLASRLLQLASRYADRLYGYRFDLNVQSQLYEQFARLDHTYYEDANFNAHLNKVEQNRFALRTFTDNLFSGLTHGVELIAAAVALITFNPYLLGIILITLAPVMLSEVTTNLRRWRHWDSAGNSWQMFWFFRRLLTDVSGIKEVKLFNLKQYLVDSWRHYFDKTELERINIERQATPRRAAADIIEVIRDVGIQLWLVTKVLGSNGRFGLGDFQFYRQIVQNFSSSSSALARDIYRLQEDMLYVEDYFALMKLEPRVKPPAPAITLPPDSIPTIEFRHVSFKYPGSRRYVLRDFNMTIAPGQSVALVGENGAGKSTIIKLLLRLYDPSAGQILIDGQALSTIDLASWYRHVGVLFQDFGHYPFLSARETIGLGRIEAAGNLAAIQSAAQEAGAHQLISGMANGYDTRLTKHIDGGVDISGGQWQRIALARAFFRDAGILILDEPTSAIDAMGEYDIFKKIAETQKDKTTIIISHRFSTVRNANTIFVIESGKISESGSHHDLMLKEEGKYRHLFELQAAGYR